MKEHKVEYYDSLLKDDVTYWTHVKYVRSHSMGITLRISFMPRSYLVEKCGCPNISEWEYIHRVVHT